MRLIVGLINEAYTHILVFGMSSTRAYQTSVAATHRFSEAQERVSDNLDPLAVPGARTIGLVSFR